MRFSTALRRFVTYACDCIFEFFLWCMVKLDHYLPGVIKRPIARLVLGALCVLERCIRALPRWITKIPTEEEMKERYYQEFR